MTALFEQLVAPTDADRARFRGYTASTIRGIKIIQGVSADWLRAVLHEAAAAEDMRRTIGADTNPSWVTARAAEELYRRGEIDERALDRWMDA